MTNERTATVSSAGAGPTANEVAADLLATAGLDPALSSRLTVIGDDPLMPSSFRIGTAATSSIGAAAVAVSEVWRERTGRTQTVSVATRHAAAAFRHERWAAAEGVSRPDRADSLGGGFFRTADDRFIKFQTVLPHHLAASLKVLECEDTRASSAAAVRKWDAFELEEAVNNAGGVAAVVLSPEEWAQHPQGAIMARTPVLEITKIGDSPPEPLGPAERPLSGLRVIDLTRVISGPTACRFLAGHGADVLQFSAPGMASWGLMDVATGVGKRSAWLDLRTDIEVFGTLVEGADVLMQAMRPGALEAFGYGPEAAAARRPGLIYVTLNGFATEGPWKDRAGYDSMLQCHNGMGYEDSLHREGSEPAPLPCQLMDHATSYIAALGILSALLRRAHEGGSYLVRVALSPTGEWLKGLGRVDGFHLPDLERADFADVIATMDTPYGPVEYVTPAEQMSETPAYFALPSVPFGTHQPVWE